jgi:hypothetical protein
MNLRFTIYDLRLALKNQRGAGVSANPQSAIRNPQFACFPVVSE